MKKRIRFIIGLLVLIILVVVIYRGFLIFGKYKVSYSYEAIRDERIITKGDTCSFLFDNFSLCLPEGFSYSRDKSVEGHMYVYGDSFDRYLTISPLEDSLPTFFKNKKEQEEASHLLKKANISTMVDLLKYLDQHAKDKFHFFSSLDDVKLHYFTTTIADNFIPEGEERLYIAGDYSGYIIHHKNSYDVNLCWNGVRYNLYFSSGNSQKKFTEEEILSIVSSIQFEGLK